MNFGEALVHLNLGEKVRRAGWNGKGMWLLLQNHDEPEMEIYDQFDELQFCGIAGKWIGMKTADNKFVPWLASQSDVLANDWEEVD